MSKHGGQRAPLAAYGHQSTPPQRPPRRPRFTARRALRRPRWPPPGHNEPAPAAAAEGNAGHGHGQGRPRHSRGTPPAAGLVRDRSACGAPPELVVGERSVPGEAACGVPCCGAGSAAVGCGACPRAARPGARLCRRPRRSWGTRRPSWACGACWATSSATLPCRSANWWAPSTRCSTPPGKRRWEPWGHGGAGSLGRAPGKFWASCREWGVPRTRLPRGREVSPPLRDPRFPAVTGFPRGYPLPFGSCFLVTPRAALPPCGAGGEKKKKQTPLKSAAASLTGLCSVITKNYIARKAREKAERLLSLKDRNNPSRNCVFC